MEKLMRQAREFIRLNEYGKALRIGRELKAYHYSGAFEILALVCYKNGKLGKAIKILEQGVHKAPAVWLLWLQLGNYLSDKGHHKKAQKAYDRALKCPHVDEAVVKLNVAINYARMGKRDEALKICNLLVNSTLRLKALSLKMQLLVESRKHTEAIELACRLINQYRKKAMFEAAVAKDFSQIYVTLAEAQQKENFRKHYVVQNIKKALELDRLNRDALWWLRQIKDEISLSSKLFRLFVEGRLVEPINGQRGSHLGFLTTYEVVAENCAEGLKFIKEIERPAVSETLFVKECKALRKRPSLLKGVYRAADFFSYPLRRNRPHVGKQYRVFEHNSGTAY